MLYTRLLSPEQFGQYALVISGTDLVQVLVFQWLHLALARFLLLEKHENETVLPSIFALFSALSACVFTVGLCFVFFIDNPTLQVLIAIAIPLSIAQGWTEINLKLAAARLQPFTYGKILAGKNTISLIVGSGLAWVGLASFAPLTGLLIGASVSWYIFGRHAWKGIKPRWPSSKALQEYANYGLPLALTFALGWITSSSDRLIIAWLVDEAATGVYAAGYDLAQQSLGLLLTIVNTAAYPLVMRAFAQNGVAAAANQLKSNGELIFTVAFAGAAGIIALSPAIVGTIIGQEFRAEAGEVLPWIACSAAIAGIKAFHLDIAFQLAKQSKLQAYLAGITAIFNVALNFILIPKFGITGAAAATMISFSIASFLSWVLGKRLFPVPPILPLLWRGLLVAASTFAGASSSSIAELPPVGTLLFGLLTGIVAGLAMALVLNIAEIRTALLKRL
jgi:O-antigen/teichoic acid export membrane protein